jgi:hypothetical protein
VVAEAELALTEKSLSGTLALIEGKVPPGKLKNAELPTEPDPSGTEPPGALTVTLTWAAELSPDVVLVTDVGTTPSVQVMTPLPAFPQLPTLVVADPVKLPSWSLKTTPATGSPEL